MATFKKKKKRARKLVYKYSIPAAIHPHRMTLFFETPSVEGADSSLPAALSFFFLKKRHEPPPTTSRRELANGDAP
jgi:hypothetical protein